MSEKIKHTRSEKPKKERVDTLLVERGFFDSREKAKRAVMAGLVFSESERLEKPGMKVPSDLPLFVKGDTLPYVSRGGLKLAKAVESFDFDVRDKKVVDIGASTGGFTDYALQHGASLVYAVDVGYNQLHWKLRSDQRVIVMERTNFRYVTASDLKHGRPQFATIDVSFISLSLIVPVLYPLLENGSQAVVLVKPQFEAGRESVGKKGVVRDPNIHRQVLETVWRTCVETGFAICGLDFSPITGGEGNIEFLLGLMKPGDNTGKPGDNAGKDVHHLNEPSGVQPGDPPDDQHDVRHRSNLINRVVEQAHAHFKKTSE